MGIFSRLRGYLSKRKQFAVCGSVWENLLWGESSSSAAGERVSPESAMGLSSYWACIANISEDIAKLPLDVGRKEGKVRTPLPDHSVEYIFNVEFNPYMPALVGRQTLSQWAKGWGNGYARIFWNGIYRPVELWPIHPSRVTPKWDNNRRLYYQVQNDTAAPTNVIAEDMFHIPGRISDDGVTGVSIAAAGCDSIGRALAVQRHSGAVFANGTTERVALKHPMLLDENSKKNIRNSWVQLYGGSEGMKRGPAILDRGMDAVKVGIPPEQAQMIDVMQYTDEDLARWFRCPLPKIQHFLRAQGWSTLEALNTDYVTDTLIPEAVRWEQEIRRKLFTLSESSLYAKHNFDSLLRGDTAARSTFYNAMFKIGVFNRDDIRAKEDLNPVPGGDVYYIESSNLAPLDEEGNIVIPEPPQPEPAPGEEPPKEDKPQLAAVREAAFVAFNHEFKRALRKEIKTVQGAVRKTLAKGDRDGFETWTANFYGEWASELSETLSPVAGVLGAVDERFSDTWADACKDHATTSKAHLLAVLRDEGPEGVTKRLDEWETTREFCYGQN